MATQLPIARMTFGVRFGPCYRIGDNLGAIVDTILREKGTPFGPEVFPLAQAAPHEHKLLNPDTRDRLVINERNLILTRELQGKDVDEVAPLTQKFVRWILQPVRDLGKIRDIHRYGILFELEECSAALAVPLTQRYLTDEASGARDLLLRFSRRLQTDEAHIRKGVNDYRNIIYTLQESDAGSADIHVDYQEYFDPVLDAEDWRKKPYEAFADAGLAYFKGPFGKWLHRLLKVDKAA